MRSSRCIRSRALSPAIFLSNSSSTASSSKDSFDVVPIEAEGPAEGSAGGGVVLQRPSWQPLRGRALQIAAAAFFRCCCVASSKTATSPPSYASFRDLGTTATDSSRVGLNVTTSFEGRPHSRTTPPLMVGVASGSSIDEGLGRANSASNTSSKA